MTDYPVEIRPQDRCAVLTLDGPFDIERAADAFARFATDPAWDPAFNVIVVIGPQSDFNDTDLARLESLREVMRGMNARLREGSDQRTAIVCTNELKRVIAALWMALLEKDWPIRLCIFTSIEEALAWFAAPDGSSDG